MVVALCSQQITGISPGTSPSHHPYCLPDQTEPLPELEVGSWISLLCLPYVSRLSPSAGGADSGTTPMQQIAFSRGDELSV